MFSVRVRRIQGQAPSDLQIQEAHQESKKWIPKFAKASRKRLRTSDSEQ
jgi:hypothetical protein